MGVIEHLEPLEATLSNKRSRSNRTGGPPPFDILETHIADQEEVDHEFLNIEACDPFSFGKEVKYSRSLYCSATRFKPQQGRCVSTYKICKMAKADDLLCTTCILDFIYRILNMRFV